MNKRKSAREAAFLAVYAFEKEGTYLKDTLEHWKKAEEPKPEDARLAERLAIGTVQRKRTLGYVLAHIGKKPPRLSAKKRVFLFIALYQAICMDRIPAYSVVNESVSLAKKHFSPAFSGFVNALLRSYYANPPPLPESRPLLYSYPDWFVAKLHTHYAKEEVEMILAAGNTVAPLSIRLRSANRLPKGAAITYQGKLQAATVQPHHIQSVSENPQYYIMGQAQIRLLDAMADYTPAPSSILDLCAAPGGKSLVASELYPAASLTVNEPSKERQKQLLHNLHTYGLNAKVTRFPGEAYPLDQLFDLVIVDAPCSNSGVLNKRAEARWRLTEEAVNQHIALQKKLLARAAKLVAPSGRIWYLTCSILPEENEKAVRSIKARSALFTKTILPSYEGDDGGFAAVLV